MSEQSESRGLDREKKEGEKFSDLVIFTATLYKNDAVSKLRQELAKKFFANAKNLGIKCVVVDGGSNQEFLDELKGFDNVELIVDPKASMGESRREGLQKGIGQFDAPYYLWVEPEKYDLIKEESLVAMIQGLRDGRADIVVPKRKDLSTMSEFQKKIGNDR